MIVKIQLFICAVLCPVYTSCFVWTSQSILTNKRTRKWPNIVLLARFHFFTYFSEKVLQKDIKLGKKSKNEPKTFWLVSAREYYRKTRNWPFLEIDGKYGCHIWLWWVNQWYASRHQLMYLRWCARGYVAQVMQQWWCRKGESSEKIHQNWCKIGIETE